MCQHNTWSSKCDICNPHPHDDYQADYDYLTWHTQAMDAYKANQAAAVLSANAAIQREANAIASHDEAALQKKINLLKAELKFAEAELEYERVKKANQ